MGGRDHSCEFCGMGGFNDPGGSCECPAQFELEGNPHIWIGFVPDDMGGMFVCGDEGGEFARAGSIESIIPYVADLLYGPGTMDEGGLEKRALSPSVGPGGPR